MAARIVKLLHDQETRRRIQASKIIDHLTAHIFGTVEMKPSQVSAALGLLRKIVPDLAVVAVIPEEQPQMVDVTPADPLDRAVVAWDAAAKNGQTGNA
jgi:hypothetical protein